MAMAQLTIIGNVGKDPDMSYTPTGLAVTKFSVAVNTKKGDKEETAWYNITAFGKSAETLNTHLKKGSQLFVQGDFSPRQYTTRDGKSGTSLDVVVDKFQFIGSKPTSNTSTSNELDDALGDLDTHPF